jgi:Cu+-exporting ATPase
MHLHGHVFQVVKGREWPDRSPSPQPRPHVTRRAVRDTVICAADVDGRSGDRGGHGRPEGTIYTCPMHPRSGRSGPAPARSAAWRWSRCWSRPTAGPNPELIDMTRRFWIGLALTLPVFVLEMGGHLLPGLHHWSASGLSNWMQLVLATPVVLWAGWPFFERGWQSLVNRSLNMFTLIAMGTGVAWIYSVVATLRPVSFPPRSAA